MADVKYRVREFTPKAGQAGSHSFFAEAVTDNVITNRELAKKVEARGISRAYEIKAILEALREQGLDGYLEPIWNPRPQEDWILDENGYSYHRWTIRDAKDGDVLTTRGGIILIYHKQTDVSHIESYCSFDSNVQEFHNEKRDYYGDCFSLATHEQAQALFDAMTNAGYYWYGEKKEVKKIKNFAPANEKESVDDNHVLSAFEEQVCTCSNMCFSLNDTKEIMEEAKILLGLARDQIANDFRVAELTSSIQYIDISFTSEQMKLAYEQGILDTLRKIKTQ